ncbi:annulin [Dermacentor silvarum]|uniref:annulin n=1 Tax=Dermacentor silvarum TaxID=543639 RepID=UPI00189A2BD4|nr:annulin [Dermacentor silvarum]
MGDVSSRLQGNDDDGQPGNPNEVVRVRSVDMYVTYNAENHFTRGFARTKSQKPAPVLRRGQSFTMVINLNRAFNPDTDSLSLFFGIEGENRTTYTKETVAMVPVDFRSTEALSSGTWSAVVRKSEDKALLVEVMTPSTCIVGAWIMDVDTKMRNVVESVGARFTYPDPIFILFNPWNKDDTVYMENAEGRFEYVLAHSGIIWRGTYNNMKPSPWKYGHFEENVLECCLYLLRRVGSLPLQACGNPVLVARHISAVVNSSDDQGVLAGNWTTNFAGGVPPVSWTGSHPILQQYFKTKKPVKFGQCWVFAGVTTAVCRALGIPARTVTNYYSAHDTQGSATVDQFYDENAKPVEKLNTDSIWNFHVWNEVWMRRPDLGKAEEYDGWQVIDATPQEMSGGIFACGPSSVKAIKSGELAKPYDCTFVFSEVNADQIYWRYDSPRKPLKMLRKSTEKVGMLISTKTVGRWEREDITMEYKFSEGTQEERDVVLKALRENNHAYSRFYLNDSMDDVQFIIDPIKEVLVGSSIVVRAKAINKSASRAYQCKIAVRIETVNYTGMTKRALKHQNFPVTLRPNAEEMLSLTVHYKDYERDINDQATFKVTMMASVPEVKYDYIAQEDFMLTMPEIEIKAYGPVSVGQRQKFTASFQNPLPDKLTRCFFAIEGPGLSRPYYLALREGVQPRSEAWVEFALTPATMGPRSIAAKFISQQLNDVEGFLEVNVQGEEPANATLTNTVE